MGGDGGMATTGSGGAPQCETDAQCPGLVKACRYPVCIDNVCDFEDAPSGALCDDGDERLVGDGAGICVKNAGAACLVGHECHSDLCTDGVCCDAVCTGGCEACDKSGSVGTCTPHAGDSDPEGVCSGGAGVCDGGSACTNGNHLFSVGFGNALIQQGLGIAADLGGSVIVGGSYEGTMDFSGTNPLNNAGGRDAYLVKLSPNGGYSWSRHYSALGAQSVNAVAAGDDNAVLFAGEFETSIQIGGAARASAGATDIFVAKLDTNGGYVWDATYGDAATQRATDVAIDAQGHVIIVGEMAGAVSFDGGTTTLTSAGGIDVFVVELDGAGAHVWSAVYGGAGTDRATGVAVDGNELVVTGSFATSIDFGGGALTSAGGDDIFIARLDDSGGELWSRGFGGSGTDVGNGVGIDGAGNAVITGSFEGGVDFGGGQLNAAGSRDVFVARFDLAGNHLISDNYGTNSSQQGLDIEADPSGAMVLVGNYLGNVNFGDGGLGSSGATPDGFIVKLAPDLTPLWRHRVDSLDATPTRVSLDGSLNPVMTGVFGNACSFGGGTVGHSGGTDVFVARYRR
jgi:hypothetical protein